MKRISLIRTTTPATSEPRARDQRCASVGLTGASVRCERQAFEVIEGTDHHVDAEVALLRNLPNSEVVIVNTELDISHRSYNDWSEREYAQDQETSNIELASKLARELSSLVRTISTHIHTPTHATNESGAAAL